MTTFPKPLPVILMASFEVETGKLISRQLSLSNNYQEKFNDLNKLKVFEFEAEFQNQVHLVRMICGFEQLFDVTFLSAYQSWVDTSEYELFAACIERNENKLLKKELQKVSSNVSKLIIAFENDLEGEYLGVQLMDILSNKIEIGYRMKFASYTKDELWISFNNPITLNQQKALAVVVRQDVDLRVGAAMTRFIELRMKPMASILSSTSGLLEFGPDMAPLLYLCEQQHQLIQNFKPKKNFSIQINARFLSSTASYLFDWKTDNEAELNGMYQATQKSLNNSEFCGNGKISRIQKRTIYKMPPKPMDFIYLIELANEKLGFSLQETVELAKDLYHKGYITNYRTHNSKHSSCLNLSNLIMKLENSIYFQAILFELKSNSRYNLLSKESNENPEKKRIPPITPIRIPQQVDDSDKSWLLFELICRHYLISLMKPLIYEEIEIELQLNSKKFIAKFHKIIQYGFASRMAEVLPNTQEMTNDPREGEQLVCELKVCKRTEEPTPKYFSESELVQQMKLLNFGMFTINIPKVVRRLIDLKYVEVIEENRLRPTQVGIKMIELFEKMAPKLVQPEVRKNFEELIPLIATGKLSFKDAMIAGVDMYKSLFLQLQQTIKNQTISIPIKSSDLSKNSDFNGNESSCKRFKNNFNSIHTFANESSFLSNDDDSWLKPKNGKNDNWLNSNDGNDDNWLKSNDGNSDNWLKANDANDDWLSKSSKSEEVNEFNLFQVEERPPIFPLDQPIQSRNNSFQKGRVWQNAMKTSNPNVEQSRRYQRFNSRNTSWNQQVRHY